MVKIRCNYDGKFPGSPHTGTNARKYTANAAFICTYLICKSNLMATYKNLKLIKITLAAQ